MPRTASGSSRGPKFIFGRLNKNWQSSAKWKPPGARKHVAAATAAQSKAYIEAARLRKLSGVAIASGKGKGSAKKGKAGAKAKPTLAQQRLAAAAADKSALKGVGSVNLGAGVPVGKVAGAPANAAGVQKLPAAYRFKPTSTAVSKELGAILKRQRAKGVKATRASVIAEYTRNLKKMMAQLRA